MAKVEQTKSKNSKKAKKKRIEKLYEKKPIIEFIVAVLSIPSILLLLLLNLKALTNNSNAKLTPTPTGSISVPGTNNSFFSRPVTREPKTTLLPNESQAPCIKGLGPVSITAPNEGDIVSSNPVEVDIAYDDSKYCSAVWSYSINGSNWSDYNNTSVALYNLPNGPIRFQLRIKSLTNSDSTTLTKNFTYEGQSTAPNSASGSGITH
jgi:hypothetical protein